MEEIRSKVKVVGKPRKTKAGKTKRKQGDTSTYDITLGMFKTGMTIDAIAKDRGLTTGTIETHLVKVVGEGALSIYSFMTKEAVAEVADALKTMPDNFTSKDLYEKLDGRYSYGQLRAVINLVKKEK